jgi:hypothetical protein
MGRIIVGFILGALLLGHVATAGGQNRERYIDYLERAVHQQATRAERNERRLTRANRAIRAVFYAAPWGNHPDERKALCVHTFEGPWDDPGWPYWGGMQLNRRFQRTYGGWALRAYGPANRWPIAVQIAVSLRAVHGDSDANLAPRGWRPWPYASRRCGLR